MKDVSRWPTDALLRRVHATANASEGTPVTILLTNGRGDVDEARYLSLGQAEALALELAQIINAAGGRAPEPVAALPAPASEDAAPTDLFAARRTARDAE